MRYIKLTRNKRAIIDDEDYQTVSKFKWHYVHYGRTGYARKTGGTRMHHLIIPLCAGFMVDHINGNGLDNRRSNLRLVTKSQNMMNSGVRTNNRSGYKGVSWANRDKKWRVTIWKMNKQIDLGYFDDKKDAAKAYNDAAKIYHGEYAKLNRI